MNLSWSFMKPSLASKIPEIPVSGLDQGGINEVLNSYDNFRKRSSFLENSRLKSDNRILTALAVGTALGVVGFAGAMLSSTDSIWQILLVNTLFFSGLSYGCLMFSAILTLTQAQWGKPIQRLADATILFIPVSWLFFILLYFGLNDLYAWSIPAKAIPGKSWWLNTTFFISRNLILLVLTGISGILYVLSSVSPETDSKERLGNRFIYQLIERFFTTDGGNESRTGLQYRFAVVIAILYTILSCLLAFDWMMSTDQKWYSSAFGFQYSVANLYAALAFLIIVSVVTRNRLNLEQYFTTDRHNDLSRLMFVFSMIWTYLVYAQILVIWYANLPAETPYLVLRMLSDQWSGYYYFLGFALFLLPFFGLFSRKACRSPLVSSSIATVVLIGLWCEKYFLTVPSIQEYLVAANGLKDLSSLIWEVLVTLGMGSLFLLCYLVFFRLYPLTSLLNSSSSGTVINK